MTGCSAPSSRDRQGAVGEKLNSGVIGVPSILHGGRDQYIAVQAGWGVDSERMLAGLATLLPDRIKAEAPQGGVVWVFALKDRVAK